MVLLFPSRNRERLLVGQLLFQRRPESSKRSQWWGRREGGKEAERGKRQRAVLTTPPSLPLLPSAPQGPTVRVTEAQPGFLEEQCLPSP